MPQALSWVPDQRAPGFAEEYRRQSRLIRDSETEASRDADEAWEAGSDTSGWAA
jgi:hypothetical protein